jgi:tRNA-dihydrouridine synthase A
MSSTSHRVCVAPMMGWTHRHCRYFHRLLTQHTRLYTEMVTTGALLQGDPQRHLAFNPAEQPVALQLGGNNPSLLARCAKLGEQWGYDEINLNCGCPSQRVKQGAFGASLMKAPQLVADCVRAMAEAVSIPISVKHRIGIDQQEDYAFLRDFVGTISEAGCRIFIVHARKALIQGLNPKQNRQVPPLCYEKVYQLKQDFPGLTIVINGGIRSLEEITPQLNYVDGVMLGRAAYQNPWILAAVDALFYNSARLIQHRLAVVHDVMAYAKQWSAREAQRLLLHPLLGLYNKLPGARHWRRSLSDPYLLKQDNLDWLEVLANKLNSGVQSQN